MEKNNHSVSDQLIFSQKIFSKFKKYYENRYSDEKYSLSRCYITHVNRLKLMLNVSVLSHNIFLLKGNSFVDKTLVCKKFVKYLFEMQEQLTESNHYLTIYISLFEGKSKPESCIKNYFGQCGISEEDDSI